MTSRLEKIQKQILGGLSYDEYMRDVEIRSKFKFVTGRPHPSHPCMTDPDYSEKAPGSMASPPLEKYYAGNPKQKVIDELVTGIKFVSLRPPAA